MSVRGCLKTLTRRCVRSFLIAQLTASTAWGLAENLSHGEIMVAKNGSTQGHIISFDRLVRADGQKDYWHLKTVSVRNSIGQVIASSDFATWNEAQGLLYLENPDRVISLGGNEPSALKGSGATTTPAAHKK
ncbi:MAG: hypothetical protein K2X47_13100 [Bdellovibrionales bacterium]|nr:hypothetical protein [Bdellovibrionales bacterium]